MKALCVIISLILSFSVCVQGQLIINNAVNAPDGVQTVLLGNGVTANNITFSGVNEQIGEFTCVGCNLGIGNGVVMGSGNVDGAPGPNTGGSTSTTPASGFGASDPDLAELSGFSLNDAAVLQFDFIPTGDSLVFNFVFGSDEYPEFANGSFNDAFGFFLSGPGISGPYLNNAANIALIPGTSIPVTINNLNNGTSGTGPCEYCEFYINNPSSNSSPATAIECDGFTTVLTAYAAVQCGSTYHIKLAIADAGDTGYDSFVFLEAGSFSSNQVAVAYTAPNLSPGTNMVYEGCQSGFLDFTRASNIGSAQAYVVQVSGTAINGVDYETINDTLFFNANQETASIEVTAFQDNFTEGNETLIVTLIGASVCGQSNDVTYTVALTDLPPLVVSIPDVTIDCGETAVLVPQVSGGIGFYSIAWQNGSYAPSFSISPSAPTSVSFVVSDTCGVVPYNGVGNIVFPAYPPIAVNLGPDQAITCLDFLNLTPTVSGGYGIYTYQWTNNGAPIATSPSVSFDPLVAGSVQLTITDQCYVQGSDQMAYTFPPVPISVNLGSDLTVTCIDYSLIVPVVSGGVGNYSYQWSDQGGIIGNATQLNYQTSSDETLSLTVSDQCGNQGNDFLSIAVPQLAMNLDLGSDLVLTCLDQVQIIAPASGGAGSFTYTWSENGLVASASSNYTIQASNDVVISVLVQDQCGNAISDQVSVSVPPVPVNVDLGPDLTVGCLDDTLIISNTNGGVGSYSYSWSDGNAIISLSNTCTYQTIVDADLTISVVDQCGNSDTDSLHIHVPPVPINVQVSSDTIICVGESIFLNAEANGGVGTLSYLWVDLNSEYQEINVAPDQSKSYTVQVSDVCGNQGEASVLVSVEQVSPGFTVEYTSDFGVSLTNQSNGAISYDWYFSDGAMSSDTDVTHEYTSVNDAWTVTLVATGPMGCQRSITELFQPPADLFIPNSFTPDGDGINDVFLAVGHDLKRFEIWIFNRWGDLVFYSDEISRPWDGSHREGDYFSQDGIYNYRVIGEGVRGNIIQKTGNILIMR